jgi:hypothetical protein
MRPDAALSGPKAGSIALNGTLRLPRAACLPISVGGLVRLRSWRRCASIIRRYFRVTTRDQESILDGHRRCRRLVLLCAGKRSNIRKPFQEGDASKYGSTARASNFSSAALRSSVTLCSRSCTSCAAMPQNSRELPPESPLGLTGKSERSLSRFELCSERRRTKKTQHVPTNATNAGDLRPGEGRFFHHRSDQSPAIAGSGSRENIMTCEGSCVSLVLSS